ncbi:MAG: hypothetical protein COA58_11195 [Bacteroidetes bacterium]|nr:MAG: hypothetical protein COA58_11195 [Bacteroidota bacterium]
MKTIKILRIQTLIICLLILFSSNAQTYKSNSWSANLYLGASNMMGDLGGSNFIGSRGVFDYDFRATRLAVGTGINMNTGAFSLGLNLLFTRLAGNDEYSAQDFQVDRNLCVRTDLFEASFLTEYRPFSRTKGFNRFYVYTGIGGIYYQPKTKLNDDWIKLRTLGTEGQYFDDGPGPYSELDVVIPYGLGYKFRLAKSTSLILDLGFRKTFTDYLDDVSTVYVDPVLLASSNGIESPILSNRSNTPKVIGDERGNPDKDDMYFLLGLKFEYILGGKAGDGCYYNRNPPKTRSTKINQRKMFTR